MAHFVELLQCTNSGAIGGTADVPGTLRAYPSDANDRQETCAGDRLLECALDGGQFSSGVFDRLLGVAILVLRGAQIA